MKKEYGTIVRVKSVEQAEETFANAKALGFEYCQLVFKPQTYTVQQAEALKSAADKCGIRIVALFAGFNDNYTKWDIYGDYKTAGINSKKYGKKRIKYLQSAAEFASWLGIKDMLVHAGFVANNPFSKEYAYMVKVATNLARSCKQYGVNLLLETGGESPITLLRLIEDIGLDNVYANLDTANVILYGYGNPVEAVVTLNKHIKSLHIKDGTPPTNSKKIGTETPIGEGFVDFKRVFKLLKDIQFDGPIIIEREIEGEKQKEDLKKAIQFLNKLL